MELPQSYPEWKDCIVNKCRIALTAHYVTERIRTLGKSDSEEAKKFRSLYGEKHLQSVLSWFRQAATELS